MKKELFESPKDAHNFLINLNKAFFLNDKEHIKKYYKARKIHGSVLDSMEKYIDSDKLPITDYFNTITEDLKREMKGYKIETENQTQEGAMIFNELFMYKNHSKIPSLTENYIKTKKFKDKEKVKMLYAMNNSFASLFKIIDCDHMNGYVTYQDVFTKKKYKIIDVTMSSIRNFNKDEELYVYNRIITFDGISFGTGLPCIFKGNNKKLKEFIKKHKFNSCSDFSRCLMLYEIAKDRDFDININDKY